ncbi:hypothetical protein K431DRAFT_284086 [Polychaeton citri CBS 116435]|uniref:KANL3/Tex30 alpha/beta hydrolase-like domain-containing protein n=1 Tax=Polychaeton citri CBS 116435 TaxID=1314669 RepID=A0A9P4UNJ1_9PEZI|nr:hypothetical protein K431DRAFT_284086 [Polychaeton citri CBS 116435]
MKNIRHEIAQHGPSIDRHLFTFAHGAKGSMHAPEVTDFRDGFSRHLPIVTFNGKGRLEARTSQYAEILGNLPAHGPDVEVILGGRSIGSRAAVELVNRQSEGGTVYKRLVLVSYALHRVVEDGDGGEVEEVRDRPILELKEGIEALFIVGDKDHLCDLGRLEEVRKRMKCRHWMCRVEGADHMMKFAGGGGQDREKVDEKVTTAMGERMGDLAAKWIMEGGSGDGQEAVLSWDKRSQSPALSGWH